MRKRRAGALGWDRRSRYGGPRMRREARRVRHARPGRAESIGPRVGRIGSPHVGARWLSALSLAAALACGKEEVPAPAAVTAHPEVLIVVNGESPVSVAVGRYYAQMRKVPPENLLELHIP